MENLEKRRARDSGREHGISGETAAIPSSLARLRSSMYVPKLGEVATGGRMGLVEVEAICHKLGNGKENGKTLTNKSEG